MWYLCKGVAIALHCVILLPPTGRQRTVWQTGSRHCSHQAPDPKPFLPPRAMCLLRMVTGCMCNLFLQAHMIKPHWKQAQVEDGNSIHSTKPPMLSPVSTSCPPPRPPHPPHLSWLLQCLCDCLLCDLGERHSLQGQTGTGQHATPLSWCYFVQCVCFGGGEVGGDGQAGRKQQQNQ